MIEIEGGKLGLRAPEPAFEPGAGVRVAVVGARF
jgi:hypothetical protein